MSDIGASIIAKLRNKSKQTGRSLQLCLQLFCQEEFLRKLEVSKYIDNLVLKGGLFIYNSDLRGEVFKKQSIFAQFGERILQGGDSIFIYYNSTRLPALLTKVICPMGLPLIHIILTI